MTTWSTRTWWEKDHLAQLTYKRINYRLLFIVTRFVVPGQDEQEVILKQPLFHVLSSTEANPSTFDQFSWTLVFSKWWHNNRVFSPFVLCAYDSNVTYRLSRIRANKARKGGAQPDFCTTNYFFLDGMLVNPRVTLPLCDWFPHIHQAEERQLGKVYCVTKQRDGKAWSQTYETLKEISSDSPFNFQTISV